MKKIVVLASLLVSLSFGLTKMQNYWTVEAVWKTLANFKESGLGECKSVQDKVKGCYVHTKNKDGSSKQLVVYLEKKIVFFARVFRTELPMPMETGAIVCSNDGSRVECTEFTGNALGAEKKEFTGDWNELVKKYVKQ